MASPPLVVVLTGGSGVGKTTLIDRLASRGFSTVPEAAMQVIDSNNNGVIDYTEFIAACMYSQDYSQEKQIRQAF